MRDVVLTCDTPACPNEGQPITLTVDEDVTAFVCGPCGEPILVATTG